MSNQMPNIPGAAVMTDTLDFVKNLWGSMSVPGLTAPTLSVDELDKKINDLKAVETWLNLNMSMLRGSIQALEVQRNTIATLKSVGASMAAAVKQGSADNKSIFDTVPYASAFFQHAGTPAAKTAPAAGGAAAAEAKAAAADAPKDDKQPAAKPAVDAAAAAQLANPALWWNLLQEQFKQAVATAMTPEAAGAAAARATDAATKFAAAATGAAAAKPAASAEVKPAAPPEVKEAEPKKAPAKRAGGSSAKPKA